ncbi:delta-endotoxin CytB [Neolentinus lepideus HHB14362 ss-1]|uniref:Delta-endotoxin CytB n=1 Tax=Neolentinus lepideus HHB14362 ss-1 TaxID=1314782 RepID=A0A165TT07_9AGAM|nr:delta-endotoxin CytB [Neolentinus lepideus HHB14362 ss-1]
MSKPITISNGPGFLCIISDELSEDIIPISIQVVKFCDLYVKTHEESGQKYFDSQGFLKALSDCDDITFDKYKTSVMNQSEATVVTMVDKIVTFLKDSSWTFTNLNMVKEYCWADFAKSAHGSSSWEYRMAVVFPNPDLPHHFYGAVTTIKLEANIQEESGWWGLSSSTSKNFSAHIDVLELVVEKGFRAPTSA